MEYEQYIKSDEWKKRREWALTFWNRRCAICFGRDNLHVHHRTYKRLGCENLNDLIVLCERCHELFHDSINRSEKTENFREIGKRLMFKVGL